MTKDKINFLRLTVKTAIIIALISLAVIPAVGNSIGKLSVYNSIIPGRARFPYSDVPQKAYNVSVYNLDANFASHRVSAGKKADPDQEVRVFLLGDSATWGTLLKPEETLSGQLNSLGLHTVDGRPVRFFNLGYPTLSLTKDLMILDRALDYQPDLIVWLLTLESFPKDKQLSSPLVENNIPAIAGLYRTYQLPSLREVEAIQGSSYWKSTLFGQRRNLADIYRLQLVGAMWAITGIDQYYPADYEPAARDLEGNTTFHDWEQGEQISNNLALDVLLAGKDAAGDIPVLFINEPILVSSGRNSDLRYNFYYPRWAYDQYRQILSDLAFANKLNYLDMWDIIPEEEFTNTAIHTTPAGAQLTAKMIASSILDLINP
ncbi:MAG: hypothetical protein P8Y37_06960 [Anaerolineales bacterium]